MVGITRIGGDVQDNANLSDFPSESTIVKLATGGFMILWSGSNSGTPSTGSDIRGQAFSSTGAKVGTEFVVNNATAGDQQSMTATLLSDGNVFVAWADGSMTGGDTSGFAIKGQVISATGVRVGSEFLINTTTAGGQYTPAVVTLANGNVMVTWEDASGTGGDTSDTGIRGQVLTAAGVKVGAEFLVNTSTLNGQDAPRMASLANGTVVVVWHDDSASGGDTSSGAIRGQLLSVSGGQIGGEFLVNTNTIGDQENADVAALAGGGFVVTWEDASGTLGDASGSSVKAQMYDGTGLAVGGEFLVNTMIGGDQGDPTVAGLDDGDFVITWRSHASTINPAREDLRAQGFSGLGARLGTEAVMDAPVANLIEGSPAIVALNDGRFVVASPSMLSTGASRGVHSQLAAWGHVINGTSGANALVGVAGADNFYVSPGHDTIDGRGGVDRAIINADDHSLFAVTTGSMTYTRVGNVLSSSTGTVDTTLTSIEQFEIFDTSAANHTYTDNAAVAGNRYFHFGSGNDVVNYDGFMDADLGGGTNQISGAVGGSTASVNLFVNAGAGFVTVTDSAGGSLVSYVGGTTQINNVESFGVRALDGQGLRADASGSTAANISMADSPYDDVLIGNSASNVFYSLAALPPSTMLTPNLFDASTGNDYKYGNGGADTFDYSVDLPTDFGDHIMDLDSDDVLDFSYYQFPTALRLGPNPIFLGTGAFTGVERQVRYEKADGKTYIYSDLNGDGVADGKVTIENGAFDLVLYDNGTGADTMLKITLAQNFINGTSVSNTLTGTMGADVIRAYGGQDQINATSGQDFVDGGTDFDQLDVSIGDPSRFAVPTGARTYTIGADRMVDSSGALNTSFLSIESVIFSTLGAGDFGDTIDASLFGGFVNVQTGNGNNVIFGTAQVDVIAGGSGSDTLVGNGGADYLNGGAGDDTYTVSDASTVVVESAGGGNDTLKSSVSYVLAEGVEVETLRLLGAANLNLTGSSGNQTLSGNVGNNVLDSGGGGGRMKGAAGDDTYIVRATNDVVVELAGEGDDTVKAALSYTLGAAAQAEHLVTIDALATTAINLTGNDYSHDIQGNAGVNVLTGGSLGDQLAGNGGADTLIGGLGDDTYVISDAATVIVETASQGSDLIKSTVSYTLAAGVEIETMRLTGTDNLNLTGNELNQTLSGNSGNNTLDSGGGGGRMKGVAGDDTYIVRASNDAPVEVAGEGNDTVKAAVTFALNATTDIEHLLTIDALATTAINLTGNAFSHDIQGNAGANVLTGGTGADVLQGLAGNDTLNGGGGADRFVFYFGTGQDTVGDFVSGSDKLDLSAFGFANFTAVQAATSDVGGNAVISLGGGDTVTLTGVLKAQIQSGDVILSSGQAPLKQPIGDIQHWMARKAFVEASHGVAVGHSFEEGALTALPLHDYIF